ncbi:acetyl-CoA hydrolase/transferase family protein [Phototrophicus methaneseepsis]|uniref:Acetyl-CoA hydrolase/transferase family protein n=1 Tax=Phototrophicus methaneseepsis TaxID=2710758 RepID=A0A7S8ED16_9CHLR|nr:acetyl-CoA hydrolase/transferase family protein [Phototrophicus methaneseepsis]QPC84742.1 acetyl-CoA hydrolase/transferase family protein [Phototrophicus methaneseepsis]
MIWKKNVITAEAAAHKIRSGQRVFLTGNCSTPQAFLNALLARHEELQEVELVQLLGFGPGDYITPEIAQHIRVNNLFIPPNMRGPIAEGLADFTPVFLSEIPRLFRTGRLVLDVAVLHVSPPDEHGYCSYGVEVGVSKSAAETAGLVIAEVNPNMPRTLGDSFIHVSQIDYFIKVDYELPEIVAPPANETQQAIATFIAEHVPDAATLQMGIGGIPDAVLRQLTGHKNLGIHTELFSDGVMDMIETGVITNARKSIHPGKVVAGFVLGSRALFTYIHNNPIFEMHPTEYVNDPFVIAQNERMVSINSALEVDLTGQVCADSIGTRFYSGVGGQIDFVRGASRSNGGKTFIALPSTARDGKVSRIVPYLAQGAGVTTSRNDVHMIVTEYGVADLYGRTIRERVHSLVNIAHPDFREELLAYARQQNYIPQIYSMA